MNDPLLQVVIALCLSLLFLSSSEHKRRHALRFRAQLQAYELLPESLLRATASGLRWFELLLAALILIPASRAAAGAMAMLLLLAYGAAILINLLRGRRNIDCGCGGDSQPLSGALVLRNALLAVFAALLLLPAAPRALHASDLLPIAALTALLIMSYLATNQLILNHSVQQSWGTHDA